MCEFIKTAQTSDHVSVIRPKYPCSRYKSPRVTASANSLGNELPTKPIGNSCYDNALDGLWSCRMLTLPFLILFHLNRELKTTGNSNNSPRVVLECVVIFISYSDAPWKSFQYGRYTKTERRSPNLSTSCAIHKLLEQTATAWKCTWCKWCNCLL